METTIQKLEEESNRHARQLLAPPSAKPRQSFPHVDAGEGTKNYKNAQEPQNYLFDHDGIQDRIDGACQRDETLLMSQRIMPTTIRFTTS